MNFGELVARVRAWRATSSGTEESTSLTYIKDTINSVYKEVLSQGDHHWTLKEDIIEVDGAFTDGTLTCTVGLSYVSADETFSTYTGYSYALWGGKMHIGNANMYYEVVETTVGTASDAKIWMDRPYQGSSGAAAYSIYRDTYPLPHDFLKMESVRLGGENGYSLVPYDYTAYDKSHTHALITTPSDDPTEYTIWKRHDTAWFTTTGSITNGDRQVHLGYPSWHYGLENWRHRCIQTADGDRYRVRMTYHTATDDVVILELDRPYGGTSAASTAFSVDPRGTPMIQFWTPPTEANSIVFKYYSSDYSMVNDEDEPLIPVSYHDVLWKGAIYYIAHYDGETPESRYQLLYRDWMEARGRLEKYQTADRSVKYQRRAWGGRRWVSAINTPYTITVS